MFSKILCGPIFLFLDLQACMGDEVNGGRKDKQKPTGFSSLTAYAEA